MSSFPTGVAVVTALAADGIPHGLTCTSLSSVTLEPPTLLICLNRRSGTLAAIHDRGSFAVNLMHSRGQRAAELFSSAAHDRFGQIPWKQSDVIGLPWLTEDAFALAECEVREAVVSGSHEVIFGEVVSVMWTSDVPLLYGQRTFATWSPRSTTPLPDDGMAK